VTDYLLGAQGIEAKIDETNQTEAYYELNPTTGARLFDANNNLIVAYRGVTSWYIYDGHGNVVGTVNGVTGAFTANPTLDDVYGVPRASGAPATKQGYCGNLGHVTDDTGLVYMRARYYDPNVGRFVSEDPSHDGQNWYIYANDNPVTNTDQNGKAPIPIIDVLVAGAMILFAIWAATQGFALLTILFGALAVGAGVYFAGEAVEWFVDRVAPILFDYVKRNQNSLDRLLPSGGSILLPTGVLIAEHNLVLEALIDSIGTDN